MIEIIFRYDPRNPPKLDEPADAAEAKQLLEAGNRAFAQLLDDDLSDPSRARVLPFDPKDWGLAPEAGSAPAQEPYAAVLGCADARVPVEIIFEQGCNDLFVVRVAGNVMGSECLGSLSYASHHFARTLKLGIVLGHLSCGAVTAAVDSYLAPDHYLDLAPDYALRTIVDRIVPAVRTAALALEQVHGRDVASRSGYRRALVESSVVLNTAWNAFSLRQEMEDRGHHHMEIVFGVYDLVSRYVRLPLSLSAEDDRGLNGAPKTNDDFWHLAQKVAGGAFVSDLLAR